MNDVKTLSHTAWNCKYHYGVRTEISPQTLLRDRKDTRRAVRPERNNDKKAVGVQEKNTCILNLTTTPTSQADVYILTMPFLPKRFKH